MFSQIIPFQLTQIVLLTLLNFSSTLLLRRFFYTFLGEKDEMSRDHMLTKQLELMDEKYSTLMRTNNFNRGREQREAKLLRKKMHGTTENMHTMMRRCEDAEVANRNTVHALCK